MKLARKILFAAALLTVLYVGSYFVFVKKSYGSTFSYDGKRTVQAVATPTYPSGPLPQNWVAGFYAPIHALDVRFFRPSKWNWQFPLRP
jgi:hypothetical protein